LINEQVRSPSSENKTERWVYHSKATSHHSSIRALRLQTSHFSFPLQSTEKKASVSVSQSWNLTNSSGTHFFSLTK